MNSMTIAMTHDEGKLEVTASKGSCNILKDSYYGCLLRKDNDPETCRHVYYFWVTCQMLCKHHLGDCQKYIQTVGEAVNDSFGKK